jgi:hypothetical protein
MTEVAAKPAEGRQPSTLELREYREQVRTRHENLTWTEQRLQRGVVPDPERDALVIEWGASGQEELIRLVGWRSQALREEETRLVERVGGVFDPIMCLDALTAAIDGDAPPSRYDIRDELAYVARELRRAGSSTLVY